MLLNNITFIFSPLESNKGFNCDCHYIMAIDGMYEIQCKFLISFVYSKANIDGANQF